MNDKEKSDLLAEILKNVRVTDESAYFNNNSKVIKENSHTSSPPASPQTGTRGNGGGPGPRGGVGGPSPSGGNSQLGNSNFTSMIK